MIAMLHVLFLLSGAAGLIYELAWSRYLALFVGHAAYAQVLVIGIYLGGMALGALAVGRRSSRVTRPLLWYADHSAAALAVQQLLETASAEQWVDARVLLEGGVASAIRAGEVELAERILRAAAPLTNWPSDDIRLQWIRATLARGYPR